MNTSSFDIPLFPLSAHILPDGRMSLRIFETRYIRMIKQACSNGTGFGICMLNSHGEAEHNTHIHPIGTYVTVEDFDMLDDGFLGVVVEGHRCFVIDSILTEKDGLRIGTCCWKAPWGIDIDAVSIAPMDSRLKEIFSDYPDINGLYNQPKFEDPLWVIYRWLELIPVNPQQKQAFLQQKNCDAALAYLSQVIE